MPTATVAYERPHECKPDCGCGGAGPGDGSVSSQYESAVRKILADLGAPERAMTYGIEQGYLARAQAMQLDPALAASTLFALTAHSPQIVEAVLERGAAAREAVADYLAVDPSGRPVGGPYASYGDAKAKADAVRGWVVFSASAEERLSYHDRQNLPDSAFALPHRRDLPLTDSRGNLDEAHIRNAASRLSMMKHLGHVTQHEYSEAHHRIESAARRAGGGAPSMVAECLGLHTHGAPAPGTVVVAGAAESADRPVLYWRNDDGQWKGSPHPGKRGYSGDDWFALVFQDTSGKWVLHAKTDESTELPEDLGTHQSLQIAKLLGERAYLEFQIAHPEYASEARVAEGPHGQPYVPPPAGAHAAPLPFAQKLHWHRATEGEAYYADAGHLGRFVVQKRTPNRRKNVLPWYAMLGNVEIGQGDTKSDAYAKAEKYARKPPSPAAPPAGPPACSVAIVERSPGCVPTGVKVGKAEQAFKVLQPHAVRMGHEEIGIIAVSVQDEMMGSPIMTSSGHPTGVDYQIEQILGDVVVAAKAGATGIWLWHLHPSGHFEATPEDKATTELVQSRMKLVAPNTRFMGHLVIGAKGYSLA